MISAIDALGVRGARTVRPQGIHLTLKFLGDVSVELIPEIEAAMDSAADEVGTVRLFRWETRGYSPIPGRHVCFGLESPGTWIVWVGCSSEWKRAWLNWDSGRSEGDSIHTLPQDDYGTEFPTRTGEE